MTQTVRSRVGTGLVLLAGILIVLWREGKLPLLFSTGAYERAGVEPQDAVYRMLDAIRDGNLDAYFDAHTGIMAASLRRAAAEMGEAEFLESLQRQNKSLRGVAVTAPERLPAGQLRTRVEYVFADRSEAQTIFLEKSEGKWRIARVETAERMGNVIPFGTRVSEVK